MVTSARCDQAQCSCGHRAHARHGGRYFAKGRGSVLNSEVLRSHLLLIHVNTRVTGLGSGTEVMVWHQLYIYKSRI